MASSAPVSRTVNIFINQASAERSLENLQKKADKMAASIEKGRKAGKDMTAEIERLSQTKSRIEQLEGVISGRLAPSFNQVRARVNELRRELSQMSADAPGYAAKFREFQQVSARFREMEQNVKKVGTAMQSAGSKSAAFWNTVRGVALGTIVGNTIQAATAKISGYFSSIISGNAKLSDSLADVRKATGLTYPEVEKLNAALSKIDTRTSHEELRRIAVGLGQIGEAATPETVAAIDKIVVALGDEFGGGAQEITTTLGTLRNNLQDIKTGNYADDMLHIGNALNELGAKGLATAPVVVDFANRLAGIAGTFGATSGQILGLSAALQELGVPAERGATSVTRLLQRITADTDRYAQVAKYAGISAQDFVKLVNTDIVAALTKFAEGARKAGADNQTFGKILKDLDADGSGTGEVLSKLAKNAELLDDKIKLASKSLKESSSITEEFNGKNTNLAATLEKIQKRLFAAFANSALTNAFTSIVNGFARMIGVFEDGTTAIRKEQDGLNSLVFELEAVRGNEELRKQLISEITNLYPQLLKYVDLETGSHQALAYALEQVNKEYERKIELASLDQEFSERQKRLTDLQKQYRTEVQKVLRYIGMDVVSFTAKTTREQNDILSGAVVRIRAQAKEITDALAHAKEGGPVEQRLLDELERLPNIERVNALIGERTRLLKQQQDTQSQMAATKARERAETEQELAIEEKVLEKLKASGKASKELLDEQQKKIDGLKASLAAPATPSGPTKGNGTYTTEAEAKEQQRAAEKARQQLLRNYKELQQFAEQQAKLAQDEQNKYYEQDLQASSDYFEKQRQAAKQAYADGTDDYHTYEENLKAIDQAEKEDRLRIQQAHADLVKAAAKGLEDSKTAILEQGVQDRRKAEQQEQQIAFDAIQIRLIQAKDGSVAELEIQRELLKAQHDAAVKAAREKGEATALIDAQYAARDEHLQLEILQKKIQNLAQYIGIIRNVLSNLYAYQDQRESDALEADRAANDQKKENLRKQLDAGRISRNTYDKEIERLDKQLADRERQARIEKFRRDKQVALLTAAINTATAVTEALPNWVLAALVAAAGAVEIATIARQKPPQYARGRRPQGEGGVPEGPSHANGGIALVDPSGRKVGEMEGGEAILSQDTYRNNRDLVDALLDASMYGGGRPISPAYLYAPPAPLNVQRAQDNIQFSRMYGGGGLVNTLAERAAAGAASSGSTAGPGLKEAIDTLNEHLSAGISTKFVWTDFDKMQRQAAALKKAASLNAVG